MSKPIHLTKNVRDDFTIDDTVVETHLVLIESVDFDEEDEFFRFRADNGATDAEFRLTLNDLKGLIQDKLETEQNNDY